MKHHPQILPTQDNCRHISHFVKGALEEIIQEYETGEALPLDRETKQALLAAVKNCKECGHSEAAQ